jgi:hypothetical protein
VGFRDWDDFVENHNGKGESSNLVLGRSLYATDVPMDEQLTITWAPDRRVLLQHNGNGYFTVIESENSKLKPDDSFHCTCFIIGQPLYLDHFVRGNKPPTLFVVGNKGGLTNVERKKS